MRKFLDGLEISVCAMCYGNDSKSGECWDGETDGYTSCEGCYKSSGPKERDCRLCSFPEYHRYAARDGRAPYFGVRGSFVVSGRLIDSVSRKAAPNKKVMLGFPNGIGFHGRSDRKGRFMIRVDSTEGSQLGRIHLGTLRHPRTMKRFFIGFALTSKAGRRYRSKKLRRPSQHEFSMRSK